MWLINTTSLELEDFQNCPRSQYAILSHRWEENELTFHEFKTGQGRHKKGFDKILKCCAQANDNGLKYTWVDTCCIDKSSSAELSEAINSMFEWYAEAKECYTFMCDVEKLSRSSRHAISLATAIEPLFAAKESGGFHPPDDSDLATRIDTTLKCGSFEASGWFYRGWTLQELLAPKVVLFFDKHWQFLGNKHSLVDSISGVTNIPSGVLIGREKLNDYSLAQRMSWAAPRRTIRVEDMAYSLLGLFDVNMPLVYGEGIEAFQRLQEAIIARSNDETIFAWTGVPSEGSGLLAQGVSSFSEAGHLRALSQTTPRPPYSMSNRGVAMTLDLLPYCYQTYVCFLACGTNCTGTQYVWGIYVAKSQKNGQYRRVALGLHNFYWHRTDYWSIPTTKAEPASQPSTCCRIHRKPPRPFLADLWGVNWHSPRWTPLRSQNCYFTQEPEGKQLDVGQCEIEIRVGSISTGHQGDLPLILRERRLLEHKDATRLSTNNRTGFFGDTRISTVTGLNLLTLCLPGCGAMFKLNKKDLSSFGKSMSPFISTVYLAFDSRWDPVCAIEFTCPSVPPLNSDDVHADAVEQAASYMKSIQATDAIYKRKFVERIVLDHGTSKHVFFRGLRSVEEGLSTVFSGIFVYIDGSLEGSAESSIYLLMFGQHYEKADPNGALTSSYWGFDIRRIYYPNRSEPC